MYDGAHNRYDLTKERKEEVERRKGGNREEHSKGEDSIVEGECTAMRIEETKRQNTLLGSETQTINSWCSK